MSRTISSGMVTHLATNAHTRCTMLRLDLIDGSMLAITDHDRPITFDLGDGAVTYSPTTGILPSDLALSTGFEADDVEISGPIGDDVSLAAVLGGRFDEARARMFQVNWAALSDGAIPLMRGRVALGTVEGGQFKLLIHSQVGRFGQRIGRTITGYCDADFGDTRCGFTVPTIAATVTGIVDERQFTVSYTGSYADDHFNMGSIVWTSGALLGIRPIEIFDWSAAGLITLWTPLPGLPLIDSTLTIRKGCLKTRPACMVYGNIINFRGFPDVPGSDQVLKYAVPGQGN